MIYNQDEVQRHMNFYNAQSDNDIKYNCKVRFLPNDRIKITCFNKGLFREEGYELIRVNEFLGFKDHTKPLPVKKKREKGSEQRERTDSLKRARDKIFEMALANDWEYMITLTLNKEEIDRNDPKVVVKKIGTWLHNRAQRQGLKYVVVPELHEKGGIHLHGLVAGDVKLKHSGTYKIDGSKKPVRESTLKKKGLTVNSEGVRDIYNIEDFAYGFTTAAKLDGNKEAVATYMTKYITKDLKMIFGNYYLAGGDIRRQLPFELLRLNYDDVPCDKEIELQNNIGKVKYLTADLKQLNDILEVAQ